MFVCCVSAAVSLQFNEAKEQKCYHDVASDVGDLQGQRQHVELTHHLEDQLGVRPRQLQQVQQVRRVADTHTHTF